MKNNKIIFMEVPQSLAEEMKSLHTDHEGHDHEGHDHEGHDHAEGFIVDPDIPLPIELESEDNDAPLNSESLTQNLAETLSWEMILSGMIQVVCTKPLYPGTKPHWIDYYRAFVLALKPEIYREFTGAAIVKARNGDFDASLEIIAALEGLFPVSPEVLLNKALILEDRAAEFEKNGNDAEAEKDNEKSLEAYEGALGLEPLIPDIFFNLGFFHLRKKEYRQARKYFSEYLPLAEDSGRREKAELMIREIESQGLDDEKFTEAIGLIREGYEEEALFIIRDFLEEHPRVANAWFVLGWALRKLGRWQDALDSFKKSAELGNLNCEIQNETAICLMELGDYKQARKELEAALREEPENVKIISNLGVLALKNNNKDEAAAFFRTVRELNPDDPIAREFFA